MVQVNVGMYDHVYTTSQWSESLNWSMNKGFIPAQIEMESGEFPPPCGTGTTTQTPVLQWSILQELHQQVLHVLFCTNLIETISGGWHSGKKSACQCRRRRRFGLDPLGREDPLENEIATHSLVARMVKNLPSKQDTWVRSPGREKSPGEGNGNPLQYSCLGNSMGRGAWLATIHGDTESDMTEHTQLQIHSGELFLPRSQK